MMENGISPTMAYWVIFIGVAVISWLVQLNLKN